ncbi:MAG: methyltransferase domain-containing protein [Ktedonobacterales bacterium]
MHSFARRLHGASDAPSVKKTRGLVLDEGVRYDLMVGFCDTFLFRGQVRALRRRTIALARLQPGEQALDVGCGTGTLALAIQRAVGATGRVAGIDPGERQIARAQAKAARRHASIEFQVGVIEQVPFPDQTFDVVFSTLMMHHLPASLKRQGLAEIARTLKPGGRLVIADFTHKQGRQGRAAHFHAGGSGMRELAALVRDAGFSQVDTQEIRPRHFSAFPGAGILSAEKS